MTLDQIKAAVEAGKTVCWSNRGYVVRKDSIGQWHIICTANDDCVGLTWKDGKTLNGEEGQFFVDSTFNRVLKIISGQTEVNSIRTLQEHASELSTEEFHLLLGRAIRQPELLTLRFEQAMNDHNNGYHYP